MVSNLSKDPSLSSGSAYFVTNKPFSEFLDEKEAHIEQPVSQSLFEARGQDR